MNLNDEKYDFHTNAEPSRYFMICSIPRSGSSLLGLTLWETGVAGLPHEYFHWRHKEQLSRRWKVHTFDQYVEALKKHRTSPNGVFGFKVHYHQYQEQLAQHDLSWLFPGIQVLYICRKDHLRQAISFARARQTGQWSFGEAAVANPRFVTRLIDDCLGWIKREEESWEWFFKDKRISPFHLTYEDFIDHYQDIIRHTLDFLDIAIPGDFRFNDLPMNKQSDELNKTWLKQYQEITRRRRWISKRMTAKEGKPLRLGDYQKRTENKKKQVRQKNPVVGEKNPKISVCILSYNFEQYLKECIESVLAQTLSPVEIVIIDDHSDDNSWEIIYKFSQWYPDIIKVYHRSKNVGMVENANLLITQSSGNLLSLMDGDDRWLPRKLELEWKALKKNPEAKIAFSNVYNIDPQGNRTGIWYDGLGPVPPSGDVFVQVFSKRFFPDNRSVFRNPLMYRSALDEVGYHDDAIPVHIDWDLKIRLTARFPVAYSGETLVEYRQHEHGIHVTHAEKNIDSIIAVYEKNKHLLDKRPLCEAVKVKRSIDDLVELLRKRSHQKTPSRSIIHSLLDNTSGLFCLMVNSLPKSGTHLLKKVVTLLGYRGTGIHISKNLVQGNEGCLAQDCLLPAGVDWPELVSSDVVRSYLRQVPEGYFASAHMPFSKTLNCVLQELGIKTLLILRDPRDVVVSMANYVPRDPAHFLFSFYKDLSEDERITVSITGIKPDGNGGPGLFNIGERWRKVLPWLDQSYNHTTYFETLVGPQGGGSSEQQKNEIKRITQHLCFNGKTPDEDWVAERIFGGTTTFHKGQIGGWRQNFTEQHKQIFKEIAGDILIEWGYEKDHDW